MKDTHVPQIPSPVQSVTSLPAKEKRFRGRLLKPSYITSAGLDQFTEMLLRKKKKILNNVTKNYMKRHSEYESRNKELANVGEAKRKINPANWPCKWNQL